ncbi:MAG: EAL domain-containing protein [Gammaproteobacteria bacterium]|nr:EAL domain-containing protein [Gammaproteobacteria bacterium]
MRMKGRLIFGISFVLFSLISLFISMHLHQIDGQTSRLRAETLTEQLATTLEVISADRLRAIDELSNNWPVAAANQVDWFNYQARSLSKMLPGIFDIWLADENGKVLWGINPQLRPVLVGQNLEAKLTQFRFASNVEPNRQLPNQTLAVPAPPEPALVQINQRIFVVYQKSVKLDDHKHWQLIALLDTQATMDALTVDLREKPIALIVQADKLPVFKLSELDEYYPTASQTFTFAGLPWQLQVQSHEQHILNLSMAILVGECIAFTFSGLILLWFRQQQKNKQVQQVYQAAADVSPDAMLIFRSDNLASQAEELQLFSCNAAATAVLQADFLDGSLQQIALKIGLADIDTITHQVLTEQQIFHRLLKTKKRAVAADWLQITMMRIPGGIALTMQDVSTEQRLQQKIRYQADHDQLTGLLNRYAFAGALDAAMADPRQSYLCYIDMDQFKLINDSCGHLAGDDLLRKTASLLAAHLGEHDSLARVGGDEFCLLLVDRDLAEVKALLDQLLVTISQFRFQWQDQVFVIGASIGVVAVTAQFEDAVALIRAADSGCYLAKNASRNSYFIVEEQAGALDHLTQERHYLAIVRRALLTDSFELYAQPIVPLSHANGSHLEILLRLKDEFGELISPAVFIPLAERQGLMCDIDEWVVSHVLSRLEQELLSLRHLDKIAINISGISLSDHKFLKKIKKLIKASTVPADMLCFEITETAAVSNMAQAQLFIQELRLLGCHFALDDFGVGMSSFGYLRNMAVDYVKIDGSFVKNMATNTSDAVMVKAITDIVHSLDKQAIAEFVGDDVTVEMLRSFGVEYAQGFGIAKPRPLTEVLLDYRF